MPARLMLCFKPHEPHPPGGSYDLRRWPGLHDEATVPDGHCLEGN
jgi:hypothetical protein